MVKIKFPSSMSELLPQFFIATASVVGIILVLVNSNRNNDNRLSQLDSNLRMQKLMLMVDSLEAKTSRLELTKDSLLAFFEKNSPEQKGITPLQLQIAKLSGQVEQLRQSINPRNPDEVLTIARLKDDLSMMTKNLTDLSGDVDRRQQEFEQSVRTEIASSNQSTTLILVVLIPLVLNFLYTLWKDFRKPEKKEGAS